MLDSISKPKILHDEGLAKASSQLEPKMKPETNLHIIKFTTYIWLKSLSAHSISNKIGLNNISCITGEKNHPDCYWSKIQQIFWSN